ncbi:protein serine/threonine phosphatase 2C [Cytidiella melzeri]|nr:protein serine/threonine phosphatase 2C [Cytidiella melzeri]
MYQIVQLPPATATDARLAYEEVKDFGVTDMGHGEPHQWAYRILQEPALTEELARLSYPSTHGSADSVAFQPCKAHEARSQDRHEIQSWTNHAGTWAFTAIFDGHMNHDTVDYVARKLPEWVRQSLEAHCQSRSFLSPESVSELLSRTITSVDQTLLSDFKSLFPGGERSLARVNSAQLRQFINDAEGGGSCYAKTARVLGGTTALVTLFHQDTDRLWVANLGDCCAGSHNGMSWQATVINTLHNGSNDAELQRIRSEHSGEPECVLNRRVLGWLAPTRAIGDAWLKLPGVYTEKIFANVEAPWMHAHSLERYVSRIKTPPYVSMKPDVYCRRIHRDRRRNGSADVFLITCSDGLVDLTADEPHYPIGRLANRWVQVVGREIDNERSVRGGPRANLALKLLRHAIGGDDLHLSSRTLTVEMDEKWTDDTTIIIQRFT